MRRSLYFDELLATIVSHIPFFMISRCTIEYILLYCWYKMRCVSKGMMTTDEQDDIGKKLYKLGGTGRHV